MSADIKLSQKLQALANGLEDVLDEIYGARVGFVIVVTPFGKAKSEAQYISNTKREDGVDMLKTLFKRWQLQLPDVPLHEKH